MAKPRDTQACGKLWMKLIVPSIGSIMKVGLFVRGDSGVYVSSPWNLPRVSMHTYTTVYSTVCSAVLGWSMWSREMGRFLTHNQDISLSKKLRSYSQQHGHIE